MATLKASKEFRTRIKRLEGFRAKKYSDAGGFSIGYGSQDKDFLNAGFVTEEMADAQLEKDIAKIEEEASRQITYEGSLNQNQQDVILDLYYNLRPSGRVQSIKMINKGDFDGFYENLSKLVKGKVKNKETGEWEKITIQALVDRRRGNQDLWIQGDGTTPRTSSTKMKQDINDGTVAPAEVKALGETISPIDTKGLSPGGDEVHTQTVDDGKIDLNADQELFKSVAKEVASKSSKEAEEPVTAKPKLDPETDIERIVRESVDEARAEVQIDDEVRGRETQRVSPLKTAKAVAETEEYTPDKISEAGRITKKFGASKKDALALVGSEDFKDMEEDIDLSDLAESSPVTSSWGSDPLNFPILMKNQEGFKKIESTKSPFLEDLSTIKDSVEFDVRRSYILLSMYGGSMDKEQAIQLLEQVDIDEGKLPKLNNQKGVNEIGASFDELEPQFEALKQSFEASRKVSPDDWKGFAVQRLRTFLLLGATVAESLEAIASMALRPKEAIVFTAQSSKTGALSYLLGGLGAGFGGAVGGPAALGTASTGFAVGKTLGEAAIGYSTRLLEDLDRKGFADVNGKRDYRRFFNDPVEFKSSQQVASKYAVYLGALDFFVTKSAGKKTIKALSGGNKSVIASAIKDVAGTGLKEGGTELGARVLPGVTAKGEVIPGDDPVTSAIEGVKETAGSLGTSVATTSVNVLLNRAGKAFKGGSDKQKSKRIEEIAKYYTKAKEVVTRRDLLEGLRKAVADLGLKENKEQVKDFIRQKMRKDNNEDFDGKKEDMEDDYALESQEELEDGSDEVIANEEALGEEYSDVITNQGEVDTSVRVKPSKWIEYFIAKGLDPHEEIAKLGEGYEIELANADVDGTEVSIPVEDLLVEFSENKDLLDILMLGDNEFSADEATADIEAIEKELPSLSAVEEDGDGPKFIDPSEEPQESDPVLRQVELLNNLRGTAEIEVHKKLQKNISRVIKRSKVDPKSAPVIAEMQFQHLRQRSEATGVPISELVDRLEFVSEEVIKGDDGTPDPNILGQLTFKTPLDMTLQLTRGIKNPAVLLHELGHSWLYDMMVDWRQVHSLSPEGMTVEQQQYLNSMQIAAELLGYDDLSTILELDFRNSEADRLEWKRVQETFAQTTEKYFLEGKFKNNRIRTLMEGLRRFLKPFADVIGTAYKQFPPFAVDPAVERMFEGILGTSDKIEEVLVPMLEEGDFDDAIFGAKAPKYREAKRDALDMAIGKFVGDITINEYKTRERLVDKAFREFRKEALEEVKDHPSIKLVATLKSLDGAKGEKISTEDFVSVFGEDAVESIPKGILSGKKKKGVKVASILSVANTASEDVLFGMLVQAKNKEQLVQNIIDDKASRKYPVVKTDDKIHEEAVAALISSGRDSILKMERDMLASKWKEVYKDATTKVALPARHQNRMVKKNVEREALVKALSKTYKGYRADNILKESDRDGKEAVTLFNRGDLDGALSKKIDQIVKFEAYKRAIGIEKAIARGLTLQKSLGKMSVTKNANNFDAKGIGFVKALIENFKEGKLLPLIAVEELAPVQENKSQSVYNTTWGKEVNDFITQLNDQNASQVLRVNAKASTFLLYVDLLKFLKKSAKQQRRLILDQRNLPLEFAKKSIIDLITVTADGTNRSQLPPVKPSGDSTPRKFLKLRRGDTLRMRDALMSLVSNNEEFSGSILGDLFNSILEGEADLTIEEEKAINDLHKELLSDTGTGKTIFENYINPFIKRGKKDLGIELAENINLKEYDINVNKSDVLGMLLHSGSESNLRHLLLGGIKGKKLGAYNPDTDSVNKADLDRYWAMIDRLIDDGVITKADFKAVEVVWKFLSKNYDPVNEVFEFTRGYNFGKVEGSTVTNKLGTFEGGYFPLFQDKPFEDLEADVKGLVADFGDSKFKDLFPHTDTSYSKARANYHPLKLSPESIPFAIRRVLQMKHMVKPIYNFGKVIGDPEVANALEERMPGIMSEIITPWVNRTLQQRYSENAHGMRSLNLLANIVRTNIRVNWFFGAISTPLTQLAGLPQAVAQVGFTNLSAAILETSQSPKEYRKSISEKSTRMKARIEGGQKRVLRHFDDMGLNDDIVANQKSFIRNGTFYFIQMAQNQVDVAVWQAAYDNTVAKLGEKRAVAHADNMVEFTQASSAISNRSNFEQTSEVIKLLLTDLTTIPLTIRAQSTVARNQSIDSDLKTRAKRRASVYLWSLLVPSLMLAGGGAGKSFMLGERDEEKLLSRFAMTAAKDLVVPFAPIIGPKLVGFAHDALNFRRGGLRLSPGLSNVALDTPKGALALYDLFTDVNPNPSDLEAIFRLATFTTGIPFSVAGSGVRVYEATKSDRLKKKERSTRRKQARNRRKKK